MIRRSEQKDVCQGELIAGGQIEALWISEALDGLVFVVVPLERGETLGDREKMLDPGSQVRQLELPVVFLDGLHASYQLAKTGAVNVGHLGQVDQDLWLPAISVCQLVWLCDRSSSVLWWKGQVCISLIVP